jgi:hypothetical protein
MSKKARFVLRCLSSRQWRILMVCLAIMSFVEGAEAQDQTGPSDLELGAAYCLAYRQSWHDWLVAMPKFSIPSELTNEALAHDQDDINRFRSYLLAHGLLTSNNNPTPFLIAIERGRRDAQECQTADSSGCQSQCTQACQSGQSFKAETCAACWNSCRKPAACARGTNCKDVEASLPF